jgi:hypothetical protein
MKQRTPVSDRRLKAAALEWAKAVMRVKAAAMAWAKAVMRVREYHLSLLNPAWRSDVARWQNARNTAEDELLRLCVKLMAVKKGKR